MKIWLIIAVIFLTIPFVTATTFYEDTEIKQGDINYVFKQGVTVDTFSVYSGGIKIDGQTLTLSIQGGELTVNIYEWNGVDEHSIGFISSVPQVIDFGVRNNGLNYHFYDGETYSVDTYEIGIDEVKGQFKPFGDTKVNQVYSDLVATPWYKKNIFEFEIDKVEENGVMYGTVVGLSYLTLTLLIIIFFVALIISRFVLK